MRSGWSTDDAPQVRPRHVRAALGVVVAAFALLEGRGAGCQVGAGQNRAPIRWRIDGSGGATGFGSFGDFDGVARLFGVLFGENGFRTDLHAHDDQAGRQDRAHNLIKCKVAAHVAQIPYK